VCGSKEKKEGTKVTDRPKRWNFDQVHYGYNGGELDGHLWDLALYFFEANDEYINHLEAWIIKLNKLLEVTDSDCNKLDNSNIELNHRFLKDQETIAKPEEKTKEIVRKQKTV
jgi:hypothetical protein